MWDGSKICKGFYGLKDRKGEYLNMKLGNKREQGGWMVVWNNESQLLQFFFSPLGCLNVLTFQRGTETSAAPLFIICIVQPSGQKEKQSGQLFCLNFCLFQPL